MILEKFKKKIESEILEACKDIAQGNFKSYDTYKERCGFIAGLEHSLLILQSLMKEISYDE